MGSRKSTFNNYILAGHLRKIVFIRDQLVTEWGAALRPRDPFFESPRPVTFRAQNQIFKSKYKE